MTPYEKSARRIERTHRIALTVQLTLWGAAVTLAILGLHTYFAWMRLELMY